MDACGLRFVSVPEIIHYTVVIRTFYCDIQYLRRKMQSTLYMTWITCFKICTIST
jgi:hypothetical protein